MSMARKEIEQRRIVDVRQASPLDAVRCHATAEVEKVGILPFRINPRGTLEVLIHAPLPKEETHLQLPFGIARGTREMEVAEHGYRRRVEMGRWKGAGEIVWREKEYCSALREGQEELGVPQGAVRRLFDCGPLRYRSETKGDYGVHFFLAELQPGTRLEPAKDSRAVAWVTPKDAHRLAALGDFKPGYLPLLDALTATAGDHLQTGASRGNSRS